MDIQGILGIDSDVRNGFDGINVTYEIDADASRDDIEALIAQSQKRSAVYDIITNPTNISVKSNSRQNANQFVVSDRRVTAAVIGAGHAGLAMSRCLSERGIDHVVLERGEVANSWRTERWDSLRLLTPNWCSRLPAVPIRATIPTVTWTPVRVVAFLEGYAEGDLGPGRDEDHGDLGPRR